MLPALKLGFEPDPDPEPFCAGIAWLEERVGLQQAMLLVPGCYLLSGIGFLFAERVLNAETAAAKAAKAAS